VQVDGPSQLAATILFAALVIMLLTLAGCVATQPDSGASTGLEGPSNRESPEEAAEVKAVINDAKPQPFPQQLEGCWKSRVSRFDSFKPLLETRADSLLTLGCCVPVIYVLCFDRESGLVSFTTSSPGFQVDSPWISTELIPTDSHTDLLFSTGDDFAALRSVGRYEVRGSFIGVPSMTATLSSQTDLRVTYVGSDKLNAEGAVEYVCSDSKMLNCHGELWANSTWHEEFTRVSP
jgi:hypothetical protein